MSYSTVIRNILIIWFEFFKMEMCVFLIPNRLASPFSLPCSTSKSCGTWVWPFTFFSTRNVIRSRTFLPSTSANQRTKILRGSDKILRTESTDRITSISFHQFQDKSSKIWQPRPFSTTLHHKYYMNDSALSIYTSLYGHLKIFLSQIRGCISKHKSDSMNLWVPSLESPLSNLKSSIRG